MSGSSFFCVCGRTLVRVKGQLAGGSSTKLLVWVASLILVRVKGQLGGCG